MCEPRRHGERGNEAEALRVLGEVTAAAYVLEALALARTLRTRPLQAHCHLGLGRLYRSNGQRHEVQEHLAAATAMYRAMGMTYWLEKADKETRELT